MRNKQLNTKSTKSDTKIVISKKNIILLLIIIFISFLTFSPSLNNGFVKWDDDWYIQENQQINTLSFSNIDDIFLEFYKGQYAPVSTIIIGFEYLAGSKSPYLLHLGSIIFHLLNIFLVYLLSQLLFKKNNISLIIAALFAFNSMHVEAIAWISAQKVLIFSFFYLLSLIYYLKYISEGKYKFLGISILFFILSALSKEQAVTLSISLFAIDYFKRRNLLSKKVLLEKIPFLIISVIIGIITIYASRTGEFFTDEKSNPFIHQIVYSSYAVTKYILYLILPLKLSAFHPYPVDVIEGFSPFLLFYLIPIILLGYIFIKSLKKNKIIAFSILFFLINLSLVLQLMPLRDFIIADRYVYIPSLGLFYVIAYYIDKYLEHKKSTILILGLFVGYLVVPISISYSQTKVWNNSISLFTDVVKKYPNSTIGWNNKGLAMATAGKYNKAIKDYKRAIECNSTSVFSYNNLGISYSKIGKHELALKVFDAAIKLRPNFAQAFYNRADTWSKSGNLQNSIKDYTSFISLNPNHAQAYTSRGIVIARTGDFNKALIDLNMAAKLEKNNPEIYLNRGVIYLNLKNYKNAITDFDKTLYFRPNFDYALYNRGIAKISINDKSGGCNDLTKAYGMGFKQAGNALQQFCK